MEVLTARDVELIKEGLRKLRHKIETAPIPKLAAREYLYNLGIIDKDGNLTKEYGGI